MASSPAPSGDAAVENHMDFELDPLGVEIQSPIGGSWCSSLNLKSWDDNP